MCADRSYHSASISRRRLLALSAASALPYALAACGLSPSLPIQGRPRSTPTTPPTLTSADWETLAQTLRGALVLPDSARYAVARQLFDPRFDVVTPRAIAYCATPEDVQASLAFARRFTLPLAVRSGGHSYAGYSTTTGLVLDVTPMSSIALAANVDGSGGTVTVGAGARLIDVYDMLAAHGLALPAGSCPSVGIAGLTLGGGVGVLARKYGLTCDNLLAADVTLADGRSLTCDASHSADLFWALRGGGGGNFGVVTSLTFQAHPVARLALFTLDWPWSSAAEVVAAWQAWAPHAPDELWSNCLLLAAPDAHSPPIARVNGVYVGGVSALDGLLQKLTGTINAAPLTSSIGADDLLDAMMIEAGCSGDSVAECHLSTLSPQGKVPRATEMSRSDYFSRQLPAGGIAALVSAITTRSASAPNGGGIGLDAVGGAINRVDPQATAFVHRRQLFSAQYTTSYSVTDPANAITASQSWLDATWRAMRPYASGEAYQNYIDPALPNWLSAYYGDNLPRLQQVKAAYDPGDFFHFAQSIPLPGDTSA